MPIEFKCNRCSKTLRVPDGSQGKPSICPGCKDRLIVPISAGEEGQGRIDVPCPKCRNVLQCDAKLDGTRGCCPSCAHVFTISLSYVSIDSAAQESFPFACPKCKQLFEGTPDKAGKKGKCTGCSEVFVIERYYPPKPVIVVTPKPVQVNPRVAKPVAAKPAKPASAVSSEQPAYNSPMMDLSSLLPPAEPNYSAPTYLPSQVQAPARKRKKRSSKTGNGSKVGLILGIAGGIGALLLLVCCGGFGVLIWSINSRRTISIANYSVDAPGVVPNKTVLPSNVLGKNIVNPTTKSEFVIATLKVNAGEKISADLFMQGLISTGVRFQQETTPISRAGLNGYRYQTNAIGATPGFTSEVYDLGDSILMLMYSNGTDVQESRETKPRMTAAKALEWDKPDLFFESLRRDE